MSSESGRQHDSTRAGSVPAVERVLATYRKLSQRVDRWVETLLARLLGGRFTTTPADAGEHDLPEPQDSIERIVAQRLSREQTRQAPTIPPRLTRSVSVSTQLGFVALLVVMPFWLWPNLSATLRSGAMHTVQPVLQSDPEPTVVSSLAVLNPENVAKADAAALLAPALVSQPAAIISSTVITGVARGDNIPAVVMIPLSADDLTAQAATFGIALVSGQSIAAAAPVSLDAASVADRDQRVAASLIPTPGAELPTPEVPRVRVVPSEGLKLSPTPTGTATPIPSPSPTPTPRILTPGRLWSNFQPQPASQADHFWVERPFLQSAANQLASPSYQFGSTAGSRYRTHHGIDISNVLGTPVQASAAGTVVHAGWDDPDILGPYGGFYGNAVVIRLDRRLPVAGGELDVYLLLGHLNEVLVEKGSHVEATQVVARVGMTGIAIGPHLHVEIRLGANTYLHSVNPYLWVKPTGNNGAVAVRILTADGHTWPAARVTLARFEGGRAVWARQIETYMDTENIGPDPAWGENGAMGSVPPGLYYLVGRVNGEEIRAEVVVNAGETTFIELRTSP